ncbi:unnamed protein product [Effrenium voratum]|nr:unnamed protein product [Effrenium voratum]
MAQLAAAPRFGSSFHWPFRAAERSQRCLEATDAAGAARRLKRWGLVVLRRILPEALVTTWAAECAAALRRKGRVGNRGRGRQYAVLQPSAAFLHEEGIVGHPLLDGALQQVLGDYAAYQLAVDVATEGSEHQPLHSDVEAADPTQAPVLVSANFPLVDVREEDGPMEILPGSQEAPLALSRARLLRRPKALRRLLLRRGDVVLRDLRTLHRGSPNVSGRPRPVAVWGFARAGHIFGRLRGGRRPPPQQQAAAAPSAFMSRISLREEDEGGLSARQRRILRLVPVQ